MLTLAGIFCLSNQKYVILVFVDVDDNFQHTWLLQWNEAPYRVHRERGS